MSEQLVRDLHTRHVDGESARRLAIKAGVCVVSLIGRWRKIGLSVRSRLDAVRTASVKITDQIASELHTRHVDGESARTLAREAGISRQGLLKCWRRLGLDVRPRVEALRTPQLRDRMAESMRAVRAAQRS
jgi:hypothetical protein